MSQRYSTHQDGTHDDDHGSTPAAWTAVALVILGCVIGGVGVLVLNWWVFAAGMVVVALGGVAGKVMQMLGFGKTVTYTPEEAQRRVGEDS